MNRLTRRGLISAAAAALAARAGAQTASGGFAGLGARAEGYAQVTPGATLRFPEDHGPHPRFRIEWWYVTAALTDEDGARCGVQWTLFRNATAPEGDGEGWDSMQLWMAHAAVTTAETHRAAERFARGGIGQAGVETRPFSAWIDDWRLSGPEPAFDRLSMTASEPDFGYELDLVATGPLVLHGEQGYSLKAERGQASYYYSQPFLSAEGRLRIGEAERRVTGDAWIDREWSSQPLEGDQSGWDWFSLILDDGVRIMACRIRHDAGPDSFIGTWIHPDGRAERIPESEARLTPLDRVEVAGRSTPVRWRLEFPARGVTCETRPVNPRAWNDLTVSYWEGPIVVEGDRSGVGYLEMTGY